MVSETNFRDISEKFLQSEASILQLSNSFTQLVDEVKLRYDFSKDEDRAADVEILLSSINKFLQCIIEYAEGGVATTRSSNLHQLCNKICKAVEDLKIKDEFLQHLSIPTFEFLFGQPTWIAKEILRMYNTAIQNTDLNVRSRVIHMKGSYYLGRLMDELPFGDIDFQLMIVETLIRLSTKDALKSMPTVNFQREEHREAFYNIDTNKFDFTARIFLNLLNETENHVVSLLCNRVTFDDYVLQEPHELAAFQGLWVDFNVKAGSVTLFINNEVFNKNSRWEMITIFSENIAKNDVSYVFNEESNKREGVAKILLKGPCQIFYAVAQHQLHNCRLLTLHSLDTEKFKEVFNQAFPKIHKRSKPKQARSLSFKQAYKPLDIVSVKSGATIPSTTFNATMDSSTAGRKRKYRRLTSGYMDQTTMSTISSRKSMMNLSVNDSISLKLDDSVDLSLINYKIKKTNEDIMKRHSNSQDISSCSNLSVLEHIKTGKDAERAVASKKMRLSNIEKIEKNDKLKTTRFSKYSQEFLSSLVDIEENENAIGGYGDNLNANLERTGNYGATNTNQQKKDNSTTLMGGLYSTNLFMKDDESITSDVFYSIENIDSEQKGKKVQKRSGVKKSKTNSEQKLSKKALKSNKDKITSQTIIEQKADINNGKSDINNGKSEIGRKPKGISSLGIHLSPDLFSLPSQSSVNVTNQGNTSERVNKFKTERSNEKKVSFAFREITNLALIDRDRDCQIDEFDVLKLERPKNLHIEFQNDEISTEPSLIQISKSKYPSTETEMFETARTRLDHEEASDIELTDKKFELFQDVSQNNECSADSSQGHSSETNFKLYKSKIKILSDIQIHSPILKPLSGKELTQITQDENYALKSKENTKPSPRKNESSNSSHLTKVPNTVEKRSQDLEERHSRIVTPTKDEDLELNYSKIELEENSGDKLSQYSETQSLVLQEEFERFQNVSQNIECSAGGSSQSSKEKSKTEIKILSDVKIHSPISKSNSKKEGEIIQDKDVIPSPNEEMEVFVSKSSHSIDQLDERPQNEQEVKLKKTIGTTYSKSDNESEEKNLNECKIEEQKSSQILKLSDNAEIGSAKEESRVKKKRKKRILLTAPDPKKNRKIKQEKHKKTLKIRVEKRLQIVEDEDDLPLSKLKKDVICSIDERNDALDSKSEENVQINKKNENNFSNSSKNQSNSQLNKHVAKQSRGSVNNEVQLLEGVQTAQGINSQISPREKSTETIKKEKTLIVMKQREEKVKLENTVNTTSRVNDPKSIEKNLHKQNFEENKINTSSKLVNAESKIQGPSKIQKNICQDSSKVELEENSGEKLSQYSETQSLVLQEEFERFQDASQNIECSAGRSSHGSKEKCKTEITILSDVKIHSTISNSNLKKVVEIRQDRDVIPSPDEEMEVLASKSSHGIDQLDERPQNEQEVKLKKTTNSKSNNESEEKNLNECNIEEQKSSQILKLSDNAEIGSAEEESRVKKKRKKRILFTAPDPKKNKKIKQEKHKETLKVRFDKRLQIVEDEDDLPLSKLKQGSSGSQNVNNKIPGSRKKCMAMDEDVICSSDEINDAFHLKSQENVEIDKKNENNFSNSPKNQSNSQCNKHDAKPSQGSVNNELQFLEAIDTGSQTVINKDPGLGKNQILIDKDAILSSNKEKYPLESHSSSEKGVEIEEKAENIFNSFSEVQSLKPVETNSQLWRSPKEKSAEIIKKENTLTATHQREKLQNTIETYRENDHKSIEKNLEENKSVQSSTLYNEQIHCSMDQYKENENSKVQGKSKFQKNILKDQKIEPLHNIHEPIVENEKKRPIIEKQHIPNYIAEDEDNLPLSKLKQRLSGSQDVIDKVPDLGKNLISIDKNAILSAVEINDPHESNSSEKIVEIKERVEDKLSQLVKTQSTSKFHTLKHDAEQSQSCLGQDKIVNREAHLLGSLRKKSTEKTKKRYTLNAKQQKENEAKSRNITKKAYKENDTEFLGKNIHKQNFDENDLDKSLKLDSREIYYRKNESEVKKGNELKGTNELQQEISISQNLKPKIPEKKPIGTNSNTKYCTNQIIDSDDELPLNELKRSLIQTNVNSKQVILDPLKKTGQDFENLGEKLSQNKDTPISTNSLLKQKKDLKKQMPKTTIDKDIKQSNAQETDEIEKSLALLFDTDESQPAKPVFSKPSKIQPKADENINVTLNTTNSMISSNVGMLQRGRKLFNKDDECENFMNFTIAQGEIEKMVSVQKSKESKIMNSNPTLEKRKTDDIKKLKEFRSVLEDHGKTKQEKSIKPQNSDRRDKTKLDKIKNTWNENRLKGNSTKRKSTRKEKLDAFYDRVIAKLQTPTRSQSRSLYSVIPRVRNENEGKYNLDFSWVKEVIQNKEKTVGPNLNFSNPQNTHGEIITQPSTSRGEGNGNSILENPVGEYDDDEIKSIMKCIVVDLCQKLAKGTLTKPSPDMQKHLIATAHYWMDIMKNPS